MFKQRQYTPVKKIFAAIVLLVGSFGNETFSQDVVANKISYNYNTLPLRIPVDAYKNYQLVIDASYKKRQVQQINSQLERARSYIEDVNTDATAYYQQKRDEQKNVSNMKASVQGANSQGSDAAAVMMYAKVFRPRLINAEEPVPEKFYDMELMTSYINLKDYKNKKDNALKVIITIEPFVESTPTIFSQTIEESAKDENGGAYTYQTTRHRAELEYALPMRVQVLTPDNREVLNFKPAKLSENKNMAGTWTSYWYAMADRDLPKAAEEKALQNNLLYINNLLANGLHNTRHTAVLYHVNGGTQYDVINTAYADATAGLALLQQDKATATAKLDKAAATWSEALLNTDEKQALPQQVAIALCFNLIEVNFALGNFDKTEGVLNRLGTYPISVDERKAMKELDKLCTTTRVLRQAVK